MSSHYIHGADDDEQERLSLLNGLLNASSLRALRLAPGDRVLDLGSGLGQLSRAMARQVGPGGRVVGVERDPRQLEQALRLARRDAEPDLVDFRSGNIEGLPLAKDEWGSFDVVHCRFVLEHLRDPGAAVEVMVRAARPGGRIVLEDDDHDLLRLDPPEPAVERLWRAYAATYALVGNDPRVGSRLVGFLRSAGALPQKNDMHFFGSCRGHATFEEMVVNFRGVMETARDLIPKASDLTSDEVEASLRALDAWSRRPDAALWYVTCWAEGTRPTEAEPPGGSRHEPLPSTDPGPVTTAGSSADLARLADERPALLEFLADSAADLGSSLRLDDVFQKISQRIGLLMDAHLFCIMLWNESSGLLEHSYSLKFGQHVPQEGGFPLGYGLSGCAAETLAPIRVADVREDPRYVRFRHAEVEIRSELAVPLISAGRLVGVLDLESTELGTFTHDHEQVVAALASHIASALENARLYEAVRTSEHRLDAELERARQIQRALLPAELPLLEGLELGAAHAAAMKLSGDFYDVFPCGEGRIGFAVGDVAGKGTPAALLASVTVGMLRARVLRQGDEPRELLAELNRRVRELELEHSFVAMLYGVYDRADRSLTLSNAGIPAPVLVGRDGFRVLDLPGLPLGSLDHPKYLQVTLTPGPGEVLIVASDGLEEAGDTRGEPFGTEGVAAVARGHLDLGAKELADLLIETADDHAPDHDRADDRTVLVLRASAI